MFALVTGGLSDQDRMQMHQNWHALAMSNYPNFLKAFDPDGKEREFGFFDLTQASEFVISFVPTPLVLKGMMTRCCEIMDGKPEDVQWKKYL